MAGLIILGLVVLLPGLWLIGTYNGFVRLRQHVKESWSGIDTELKRRYNLIPNLIEVCKGYAAHEKTVFDQVTRTRSSAMAEQGGVEAQARQEDGLVRGLDSLLAVAEAYPDLKASEHFLSLQRELINTEDRIQAARRFYNANVRDLNMRCQVFPASIVAGMFNIQQAEFFEVQPVQRVAPAVDLKEV